MKVRIPQARGAAIAVIVAVLFIGGFLWLALVNLLHPHRTQWMALLASVLWIALVALITVLMIRGNGGVGRAIVQTLGNFSMKQFVGIDDDPSHGRTLSYGFRLLGRKFEYLRVSLDGIESIRWSTGQLSDLRGKDCGDWSVALWCDTASMQPRLGVWDRSDPQHVEIIGLTGPKPTTEVLGRALVAMVKAGGVLLTPDVEGCRFSRAG
jgi:hypothetical protein